MDPVHSPQVANLRSQDVLNERHPSITASYRRDLALFQTNEQEIINTLRRDGFQVGLDEKRNIAVRWPGENQWRRVDPSGFKFSDIGADIADMSRFAFDGAFGIVIPTAIKGAGILGAPGTMGASLPASMVVSGAITAGSDAALQLAGVALGRRTEVNWESVAWAGAVGALFPGVQKGAAWLAETPAGRALIEPLKQQIPKMVAALKAAGQQLLHEVQEQATAAGKSLKDFLSTSRAAEFMTEASERIGNRLAALSNDLAAGFRAKGLVPAEAMAGGGHRAPIRQEASSIVGAPMMRSSTLADSAKSIGGQEGESLAKWISEHEGGLARGSKAYIDLRKKVIELAEHSTGEAKKNAETFLKQIDDEYALWTPYRVQARNQAGKPLTFQEVKDAGEDATSRLPTRRTDLPKVAPLADEVAAAKNQLRGEYPWTPGLKTKFERMGLNDKTYDSLIEDLSLLDAAAKRLKDSTSRASGLTQDDSEALVQQLRKLGGIRKEAEAFLKGEVTPGEKSAAQRLDKVMTDIHGRVTETIDTSYLGITSSRDGLGCDTRLFGDIARRSAQRTLDLFKGVEERVLNKVDLEHVQIKNSYTGGLDHISTNGLHLADGKFIPVIVGMLESGEVDAAIKSIAKYGAYVTRAAAADMSPAMQESLLTTARNTRQLFVDYVRNVTAESTSKAGLRVTLGSLLQVRSGAR